MTFDIAALDFDDPTQLELKLSPTELNQVWHKNNFYSTSSRRWNAYLNQICLNAILPWIRDEYDPEAKILPNISALPSYWELINGTAVKVGGARLLLVPQQTIHLSELRVPQEWIDIPSWATDYYLAVQVNPDNGWVRIWGYATHQQLKNRGNYQASNRTYCLVEDDLIRDIDILWVARQLCPNEPTRAAIALLPTLPLQQAENLLQRLGNPEVRTPRLEVPFQLWGALLEHGGWRKRLYQKRLGMQEQWSVLQWLSGEVSQLASELSWERIELQPSLAGSKGETELVFEREVLSRQLVIADQQYNLRVVPQSNPEDRIWRFVLSNASPSGRIPGGFKLRLLTEDLQDFENNEDVATTAVDQLYIVVELALGEGIVWETEPIPENYDREILLF